MISYHRQRNKMGHWYLSLCSENIKTFTHAIPDAKIKIFNASLFFFYYRPIHHMLYWLDILVYYLTKKRMLQADNNLIHIYSNG
jgi:hypothetical protein